MSFNHSEAFYYCDQLGGALAEPTNNLRQAVLAGLASDLAIDPDLDHWWIGKYNYTPSPWLTLLLVLGKNRVNQISC